jgi:hypothetical protein
VEKYSLREKEWACSVNNNTHNSPDILVTLCRKYRKRPTFFDIVPLPFLPRPLAEDRQALPATQRNERERDAKVASHTD